MDESLPLRRSTRNSVALKNEELTPRKKKVSTPVKVEPSTPSRRTRASSATPKKNLIEVMNTPKKTLPVLNEEENTATTSRTPAKKIKEPSPKTPSRRRLVRESVSTPTRVSIDKSSKKPVDASEESNVTLNRPLTRAKRKTMGDIQVLDVTKTSEPEKAAQNKKDKAEADMNVLKSKEKSKIPDIDDKTNKSADIKTEEESFLAKVPKVAITDFKKQELNEAADAEKAAEENERGTFISKSPVRAEDVAITSPRKVPESCKSISEASLISDKESINSKNQKANSNSPSSEGKIDTSPVKDATNNSPVNITAVPDIVVTSPKKFEDSKDVGASNVPTSPQKVDDPKDNNIPLITITSPSPQKVHQSKGADMPNIVSSPSPPKVSKSEDKNKNGSDTSSEQNTSPRKNDTKSSADVKETDKHEPTNVDSEMTTTGDEKEVINIGNGSGSKEVKSSSPQKINENNKSSTEEKNEVIENSNRENNETQMQADTNSVSSTKTDQNEESKDVKLISSTSDAEISSLQCQSPKKVDAVENNISDEVNQESTVQSDVQVSSDEIPLIEKEKVTDMEIKNKDSEESIKTSDKVKSNDNVTDSTENKDVGAEKSAESDSKVLIDEINVSEMVANANEAVMKDDATPAENESSEGTNESKLISAADESFELNISDIDEINAEDNPEEVKKITSVTPATEETATGQVEIEKSEKDELNGAENDSPSMVDTLRSPDKITSSEVVLTEASAEDKKVDEIPSSTNENTENNCGKVEESSKEATDVLIEASPVRHNEASSSQQSNSDEIKPIIDNREAVASGGIENPPGPHDEPKRSPTGSFRFDCEISDDSRDSGIQHDESVRTFKSNTECPNMSDDDETNDFLKHKDSLKKSIASGSGVSDVPSVVNVGNENEVPSTVEDKTETIAKNSPESSKLTSLNESLMSANDFLNSEEESSTECEKGEESDSSPGISSSEKKPSEDLTKTDVDHAKDFVSETEDNTSLHITQGDSDVKKSNNSETKDSQDEFDVQENLNSSPAKNGAQESQNNSGIKNSPDKTDVQESQNYCVIKNSPDKIDVQESQNNSEIENSPDKTDVQESQNNSEIKDSPDKIDVQESQNNSEIKNSPDKTDVQESQNNSENKDSPAQADVQESQKSSPAKTDVQENLNSSQTKNSPAKTDVQKSQKNSQTENSPAKTDVKESQNNLETKNSPAKNDVQDSLNNSEIKNSPRKNELESLNNSETKNSPGTTDEQECDKDSQTMNSPGKAEQKFLNDSQTTISPRKAGQESLDDSQIMSSPKLKVENFIDDSDSSESLDCSTKTYHDFIKKTITPKEKFVSESDDSQSDAAPDLSESLDHSTIVYYDFIKKTTKSNNKKIESESDGSQSDSNSEFSIPSNAATEGSSDGPLTGRDFIEFEAEEGEETEEEDDSFIVQSAESSSEASSDAPNFNMKLRKRKKNLDIDSSDRQEYTNSVKTLVDSSEDDKEEDNFIKNKKQKLEKNIAANKKTRRPKSILRNKETIIESVENIHRNKSETDINVVKEPTKIGVFIISSISQDLEEPKLPRKTPKSSKIHSEQKKSTISQKDYVPMAFNVSDADDAALSSFVVSYDESYLVAKKPRKEVNICSESISKKKKIKEGKIIKKTVKKSLRSESKEDDESEKESQFVVTLILPITMKSSRITSVLSDLGINDISSITFPKPKIATVEFSNEEPFKKLLEFYGELKYNNKPIYILEGCSVV